MAMKLIKAWGKRGCSMDVVLYKKCSGSTYVDPHEDEKVAFKDLPNLFPLGPVHGFSAGSKAPTRTSTTSSPCISSTTWASTACM
ncbi:hypothetical protein ACU4GD_03810 [Cupriavidus basilensis]